MPNIDPSVITLTTAQVFPELLCTAGTLLSLNYAAGTVLVGAVPTTIAASSIAMAASSTNYVFVNAAGVVTVNQTGFPTTGGITPMATVATNGTTITTITDKRSRILPTASAVGFTSGFRAYQSVAQTSIPSGSTKLTFTTSVYDTLSEYNTSTSRFTATAAGTYQFSVSVANSNFSSSTASPATLFLWVNGVAHTQIAACHSTGSNGGITVVGSIAIKISANDYVEVYFNNPASSGSQTVVGATTTFFSGTRIQ